MWNEARYYPADSALHRMDPRAKLLCLLLWMLCVLLVKHWAAYVLLLLLLYGLCRSSKIPLALTLGSLLPLYRFYLLIFIMNALFYSTEGVFWKFWIITPSLQGILQGLWVLSRMLPILLLSNLYMRSTKAQQMQDALHYLLRPLAILQIPVEEVAMILSIALQFIPILMEESALIKQAQIARGARLQSHSLWVRGQAMLALIVPVFLAAFQRADELAQAMEARGYRSAKGFLRSQEALQKGAICAILIHIVLFAIIIIC